MKNCSKGKIALIIGIIAVVLVVAAVVLELTGVINIIGKSGTERRIPVSATAKDEYGIEYAIEFDEKGNQISSKSKTGKCNKQNNRRNNG